MSQLCKCPHAALQLKEQRAHLVEKTKKTREPFRVLATCGKKILRKNEKRALNIARHGMTKQNQLQKSSHIKRLDKPDVQCNHGI